MEKTNEFEKPEILETDVLPSVPWNIFDARCYSYEERLKEEREKIISDKNKEVEKWRKMAISCLAVLGLFLAGIFGTVFYVLVNYDIGAYSYVQDVQTGNANFIGNDGEIADGQTNNYNNEDNP